MKNFDFYEFTGIFLPGAIVLFGLAFYFPIINNYLLLNQNQFTAISFLLILSYAVGHLLQSIGNVIESMWWFLRGGWPTDWMINEINCYPGIWRKKIYQYFKSTECEPFEEKKIWRHCVRVIYAEIKTASRNERIDIFNGNYGLHRGIASAILVILLSLLILLKADFKSYLILVSLFFLSIYRMDRFGRHYAKELFAQFFLLRS